MQYVQSILHAGTDGVVVEVECQLSNGLPAIVIVGLGNKAVDEAKERIRSAFASSGLQLPKKRITVNLAPADIPKDSTSFDLPIAAAILQASNQVAPFTRHQALIGEIGLGGTIRPVRGIIGKILAGKRAGIHTYFVPHDNAAQASLIPDISIISVKAVKDLCSPKRHEVSSTPATAAPGKPQAQSGVHGGQATPRLGDIAGQAVAKRALEIAAAGGHNILLHGPPGTGKSMLAKALAGLLPPPSTQEILEITHLHSLANENYDALITTRPCRSPHNNTSYTAMLGGGVRGKPGEISLSHHGILFLDEMPEYSRTILEALRQPLEDKCITISRARHSYTYSANFILAGTANPCPCGHYGNSDRCICTSGRINAYRRKLSGPIIDRIDLHVTVDPIAHNHILAAGKNAEAGEQALRQQVAAARQTQHKRLGAERLNSDMNNAEIKCSVLADKMAVSLLNTAAERLGLSARGYVKTLRIARTIADLGAERQVLAEHISEALQYRSPPQLD